MTRKILIITLLAAVIAGSCYYDSEEYLYPQISSGCDTTAVTFSGTILPMLQNHCMTCHSNNAAPSFGGNIKLENYADVSSQSATVLSAIRQDGSVPPMPLGGAKLNDCLIGQFAIWVNDGTPQN